MDVTQGMQVENNEDFSALLATLLDDVIPTSSLQALPLSQWQSSSQLTHNSVFPLSAQEGVQSARVSGGAGSTSAGFEDGARKGYKRSNSNSKAIKGVAEQVQELQQHLDQQRYELQQQLRRKLYLTERMAILQQLIQVREGQEKRLQQIRAGLTYNPFIALGSTVKEFTNSKPSFFVQKFNRTTGCLASCLSSAMPLLQKYPHVATFRPPASLLSEIVQAVSLAEPSNPHGAAGLEIGSLTVPVPAEVLAKFAAAYSLDLSSMSEDERNMLESCVVVVVYNLCLAKSFTHAFFALPEMAFGAAIHVDAAAVNATWDELATSLSSVQLDHEASGNSLLMDTSATVADEAHWQNVAVAVGLTDKQKLQTAVLWEIISGAKSTIMSHRAQLAQQLSQLLGSGEPPLALQPAASGMHQLASGMSTNQPAQQSMQHEQGLLSSGLQRQSTGQRSAAAACWSSPEQLTKQETLIQRLNSTLVKERLLIILAGNPFQVCSAVYHSSGGHLGGC